MRFLFNNKEILDFTVQMILSAIRIANNGSNEKDKMRTTLKQVLEEFLNV